MADQLHGQQSTSSISRQLKLRVRHLGRAYGFGVWVWYVDLLGHPYVEEMQGVLILPGVGGQLMPPLAPPFTTSVWPVT